jgi:hypothetical protein
MDEIRAHRQPPRASRKPPSDAALSVAGILLCVMDNRDLTKCECFVDLALAETKERVNQILIAAMSDWASLARFRPQATRSA